MQASRRLRPKRTQWEVGVAVLSLGMDVQKANCIDKKLIASVDTIDNGRYDYVLSNDIVKTSGLGSFPWYTNVQIEVDGNNLLIYYLNKKQHEIVIPNAFLRFEKNINSVYIHVGWGIADVEIEDSQSNRDLVGWIKNINIISNDFFIHDQLFTTCANGNACRKKSDERGPSWRWCFSFKCSIIHCQSHTAPCVPPP